MGYERRNWWINLGIIAGIILILGLVGLVIFRMAFVNYVDQHELGYKFDRRTGETSIFKRTGYFVNPPIVVAVHSVDLRPMQVCISANSRVLNCKLVKFNPEGLGLFLKWHGRGDYSATALNPILMSYAYDGSGKNYPFLDVMRELKSEEGTIVAQN